MKKILLIVLIVLLVVSCLICVVACKDKKSTENTFDTTKSYKSEEIKFWIGIGKAYTTLEDSKFDVFVSVSGGEFESWLQGTYTYDEESNALVITATWEDNGDKTTKLTGATSGQAMTYKFTDGVCEISVDIPSAGSQVFEIVC